MNQDKEIAPPVKFLPGMGEGRPFGGLKFRGPASDFDEDDPAVTVVVSRDDNGAWRNDGQYVPPDSDESDDVAFHLRLDPDADDADFMLFRNELAPPGAWVDAGSRFWALEEPAEIYGLVLYVGHITLADGATGIGVPAYDSAPPGASYLARPTAEWNTPDNFDADRHNLAWTHEGEGYAFGYHEA